MLNSKCPTSFSLYSVGNEPKVITGTFRIAKMTLFPETAKRLRTIPREAVYGGSDDIGAGS